ncbi:metabotropic glutamate receptor 2-like [Asterias rubens]|uniref:metabotropic glutamate receptor 2-like n=1 Tax=Asterias rubens TaxID=7604 RepID=UPI001454EDA2|nr:metabotropic glutamate receptor 2-like [Asterias rubens]
MFVSYSHLLLIVLIVDKSCSTVDAQAFSSNYNVYEESGDYIIGGLLPVHYENCFSLRELETLHRLEAMAYAVRQVNNDPDILPNVTLGFRIYDTCSYEPVALSRATLFIPASQIIGNTSGCDHAKEFENTTTVIGIIGSEKSVTTQAAAQLFSVYDIPLVSFFATSDDLDDTGRFPYFLRMIPPDDLQVKAIIDILLYFKWDYVSIIYSGDSYGRNALDSFRQNFVFQESLCLAIEFEVKTNTSKAVIDGVIELILSRADTSKVVIMFTQINHANMVLKSMTEKGAMGRIQLIGSDGWGMSIGEIDKENREMALGAIKTQLPDEEDLEFEDYFKLLVGGTNPTMPGRKNPWLGVFTLVYLIDCLTEGCDLIYHSRGYSESSGVSRVIDSVKAYAYALDYIQKDLCKNPNIPCDVKKLFQSGKLVFEYIKKVTSRDSPYTGMFSKEIDVKQMTYELEVIARSLDSESGGYELRRIGEWNKLGNKSLTITEENIPWSVQNGGNPPTSYCSQPCEKGYLTTRIGDHKCCWKCTPCPERSVVNDSRCVACEDTETPDEARLVCLQVVPSYILWNEPVTILLSLMTSLGILTTCLVLADYIRHNQHSLIKASSRELSYIMLSGVLLSYTLVFFLFGEPTVIKCYFIRHCFMMSFTLTYAPLLTRANRIYRIFKAGKRSAKRPSLISPKSQVAIAMAFVAMQLLINIAWQIQNKPKPEEQVISPGVVEIMCNTSDAEMIVSLSYNVILVLLCSVHAFMTRKVPTNYNESRFISLSVYTTVVIWLAFIPCYFLLPDAKVKLVVMSVALIFSGSITLVFMFFTKLYAVHFVAEANVHAAGTYKENGSTVGNANLNNLNIVNKLNAQSRQRAIISNILRGKTAVAPSTSDNQPMDNDDDDKGNTAERIRQRCFHSLNVQDQAMIHVSTDP